MMAGEKIRASSPFTDRRPNERANRRQHPTPSISGAAEFSFGNITSRPLFALRIGADKMVQKLTIHRTAGEWVARDVTGSNYGRSSDLFETIEAAERLAKRIGATVNLSRDAQNHLFALSSKKGADR